VSVSEASVRRDLTALFAPRSVAVVGASDDPVKWGNWLGRGALRGERRRAVFLVNRRGGEVLGRRAYRSLGELPEPAELVVVAVPPHAVEPTVEEAIATGARAIVAITAGEADGDAGGTRDAAIAARAREAGVALLGPNCLGVFDAGAELELVPNPLPAGRIGLISQSGNLALELGILAEEAGLGFSRFVSLGNQADIEASDLARELAGHDGTELIALYIEDFRDGRAFAGAAAAAVRAGKPVVLLTIEHSEAAARAVRSHTGALASDARAIDAACRAAGIERVRTPYELIHLAQGLLRGRRVRGRRVAVLADGGGHGGIAAALAYDNGLQLPRLSDGLVARLRHGLPPTAACANPIDLAGGGEQDIHSFDRSAQLLLASGEVDAVLITGYFGGYSDYVETMAREEASVAEALADAADANDRPLFVQTMYPHARTADVLRRRGVPVYRSIERAVAVLARLAGAADRPAAGVPALPPPAEPIAEAGYSEARELLAAGGVRFAPARVVATPAAGAAGDAAAAELGYPVVVKALGMLHKSDAGGVVLGLRDEDALAQAVAELEERLRPPALSVERMAPVGDGVELLVGARWDPRFGPVVLVGLGGLYTEILRDVAVALAPVEAAQAERLLLALRAAPLLGGARGRRPVDTAAAAEAIVCLSRVAASHPEIAEIEVNPLLVTAEGALGLDARMVPAGREEG
jgi:acetate---CoA ligase (ADP-forming)